MKRHLTFFAVLAGCAALGFAAEDQETIMKAMGAANGSLRKNVTGNAMNPAAKDAQTIADLMKREEAWWADKNAPDAVKFAQDGQTFAKALAEAAGGEKADAVAAAQKSLGGTCQGCHMAHREKVEGGGYKTKM